MHTSSKTNANRGIVRWLVRETMGLVMLAALLFISAGRWDWPMGWALVVITALWIAGTAIVTIPRYPELLAERVGPRKGSKAWDAAILGIVGVMMLVKLVVAGLDLRYGWTREFPAAAQIIFLVIAAAGYALVVWATSANAYFAQTVRIQTERGHKVAAGGPYRYVRHPAYIGIVLFELGSSIMLGSWWALIPGGISAVLFVIRTALEDKTLQAELAGYTEYAQQTRYRLLPGIW